MILSLSPYFTHQLQPLDVSFNGPLRPFYFYRAEKLSRTMCHTISYRTTYCTAVMIQSSFQNIGIYSTNPKYFFGCQFYCFRNNGDENYKPPFWQVLHLQHPCQTWYLLKLRYRIHLQTKKCLECYLPRHLQILKKIHTHFQLHLRECY